MWLKGNVQWEGDEMKSGGQQVGQCGEFGFYFGVYICGLPWWLRQ